MSAFQDDASEESYEDPVMLRLSGGSPGSTPTEGELSALEALFSTSLAKLLDTHPDRVSWLESSDPGEPLRVDFLFYPADPIEEPDAPPCRELSNRLEALLPDQAAPGDLPMRAVPGKLFAEVPELAVLTGCLLSEVDEDDEIAEWVDEEEALFQLDKNSDPLATVRNLFLPLGETLPVLSVLTFDNVEELERQGFTTLTDVLPAVRASGAGAEALRLARAGDGFSKAGLAGHDQTVRDDVTCFLSPGAPALTHPDISLAAAKLREVQKDIANFVELRKGVAEAELQLAVYDPTEGGGAGYERHRDGFPDGGDGEEEGEGPMFRRVTAIVYLNEEGWKAEDGGELRLFPTDGEGGEEEPVDVSPVGGSMVVFMAGAVEHEVVKAKRPRMALTGWFS